MLNDSFWKINPSYHIAYNHENLFAVDVGPASKHVQNILIRKSPENPNNSRNINK